MNIVCIVLTIVLSLISTSYCYYEDDPHSDYRAYRRRYSAYRVRPIPNRSYGRGYQQSFGEIVSRPGLSRGRGYGRGYQPNYGELHPKPIAYPIHHSLHPNEHHPLDQPGYALPPGLEADYSWYKDEDYKTGYQTHPKKYSKLFEGMTFYSKSKPIYVEKKPIIKIIQQPVYVKQPIVIQKQPVIHKEEKVTITKGPAVVAEEKVPVIDVKSPVEKKLLNEEKQFDGKQLISEKAAIDNKPEAGKPVAVDKPVLVEKPKEELKPGVALHDKNEKGKENFEEKKPLPELEDP